MVKIIFVMRKYFFERLYRIIMNALVLYTARFEKRDCRWLGWKLFLQPIPLKPPAFCAPKIILFTNPVAHMMTREAADICLTRDNRRGYRRKQRQGGVGAIERFVQQIEGRAKEVNPAKALAFCMYVMKPILRKAPHCRQCARQIAFRVSGM